MNELQEQLVSARAAETRLQTSLARVKSRCDCLEKDNEELVTENGVLTKKLLEAQERLQQVCFNCPRCQLSFHSGLVMLSSTIIMLT